MVCLIKGYHVVQEAQNGTVWSHIKSITDILSSVDWTDSENPVLPNSLHIFQYTFSFLFALFSRDIDFLGIKKIVKKFSPIKVFIYLW